ncbi:hypothetical protein Barb4_04482 [Bacteroidales bacterium Barb4]|nr:hypothetical protein Barb4_04482 [Bacteroidales bacterium Barb4]
MRSNCSAYLTICSTNDINICFCHFFIQLLNTIGCYFVITIHKVKILSFCGINSRISCGTKTKINRMFYNPYIFSSRMCRNNISNNIHRLITSFIVNDKIFYILVCLI